MFHIPAHKNVEHPAAQIEIAPAHPYEDVMREATVEAIKQGRVFVPIAWKRASRGVYLRPRVNEQV